MVTSTRNPQKALQAIASYAEKEYGVGTNKAENKTRLQTAGFELSETIFYKGIMPSEKVSDLPVDCNTLAGSVNL